MKGIPPDRTPVKRYILSKPIPLAWNGAGMGRSCAVPKAYQEPGPILMCWRAFPREVKIETWRA